MTNKRICTKNNKCETDVKNNLTFNKPKEKSAFQAYELGYSNDKCDWCIAHHQMSTCESCLSVRARARACVCVCFASLDSVRFFVFYGGGGGGNLKKKSSFASLSLSILFKSVYNFILSRTLGYYMFFTLTFMWHSCNVMTLVVLAGGLLCCCCCCLLVLFCLVRL